MENGGVKKIKDANTMKGLDWFTAFFAMKTFIR